jgi:hypothetical protein
LALIQLQQNMIEFGNLLARLLRASFAARILSIAAYALSLVALEQAKRVFARCL